MSADARAPVLYLAPWVDVGGSDKGTIDWFRFLDRDRFAPSLITTQPSPNRRLGEIERYAREVWDLPQLMRGGDFARFILGFIDSRAVRVVHIMNSRLGFDLLPDIAGLPSRPAVVVQLHVEEPPRSGYVRYVATRYGNLVDAFSVSSHALSDELDGYDVPVARRRVIRTGVDAKREFCPARVKPVGGLDRDLCHILFPGRLTAQKDPLAMIEVATRLRARRCDFQVHVVGEGDLEQQVRAEAQARGLSNHVLLHGPVMDVAPWYAACDLVLLTSSYEGVPYVAYEAMAMATPFVGPDLPGVREVVMEDAGVLIAPGAGPDAYACALADLAADQARRQTLGSIARTRALTQFSLERMAAEHEALYAELLAARPTQTRSSPVVRRRASPALRARRPGMTPLVSVIVPCFNHGRYLRQCLSSIAEQTYSPIETIVVDDCSTDPETLAVLADVRREGHTTVLRTAANRGPGPARNTALPHIHGRYVLPLDADNVLLPDAVGALVEQLSSAGERIGFVYPNYKCFGNRTDYFEPPSYNLYALLQCNYCDTCSLVDRQVFELGFSYPEDLELGHEDWDFVLSLAEHGIFGEPAAGPILLYRKSGFTRSDLVEASGLSTHTIRARHPALTANSMQLKGEWNPAVSVIALDPIATGHEALNNLLLAATRQSCQDFEVIVPSENEMWPTDLGQRLRCVPSGLARSRAEVLALGVSAARGRYALATYGSPAVLLADPAHIEKVLTVLSATPWLQALAFAESEAGEAGFALLEPETAYSAQLTALCWPLVGSGAPAPSLELPGGLPLETLAHRLSIGASAQWRQLPRRDRKLVRSRGEGPGARLGAPFDARARDGRIRARTGFELPAGSPQAGARVRRLQTFTPLQSWPLCRYVDALTGRYEFTNSASAPPGFRLDRHLGSVRSVPFPGTASLRLVGEGSAAQFILGGREADPDAPDILGFVEQAPLPLLDQLVVGRHRLTGQQILVAGVADPLAESLTDVEPLGYIEAYPMHPQRVPHADRSYGLLGLVRALDVAARRHRYGVGTMPGGELAGELGALLSGPMAHCRPVWVDDAGLVLIKPAESLNGQPRAAAGDSTRYRPSLREMARWAGGPLTWRGFSGPGPRLRAAARRTYDSLRIIASRPTGPPPPRPTSPIGYLLASPAKGTLPLYAAVHPVTGDQLLSTDPSEPSSLGYGEAVLLGHVVAQAPVTGKLGLVRLGVPWAVKFGLVGGDHERVGG